jgi:hypothetical protein
MRACVLAAEKNGSVQTHIVGMPLSSSLAVSCKLHDMQEPQSPIAVTTASQFWAKSSIISGGAILE